MMVLVGVAVLTFASLVFFVERDSEFKDGKWTFLDSVWWGILTVTTVGHHVKYVIIFIMIIDEHILCN